MKSLVNQHWTSLSGEPIAGRVPPRLLVMNGVQPNPRQMGEVAHHYKLLTFMMKVAVVPHLVQERTLRDGTRIRMVSSYGVDTVMVWPAGGGGGEIKLPHGFVVVTNWSDPAFYGNVTKPGGKGWAFRVGLAVPQAVGGIHAYTTRAHTAFMDPKKVTIFPSVVNGAGTVWDLAKHKLHQPVSDGSVPVALQVKGPGGSGFGGAHAAHCSKDGKITGPDIRILYQAELTAPILSVDPETASWMPATSDSEGNEAALQHWRHAVVSPTANIWRFRLASETVRRTSVATYAMSGQRNVVEVTTPFNEVTATAVALYIPAFEDDPRDLLHSNRVTYDVGYAFADEQYGIGHGSVGMEDHAIDLEAAVSISRGGIATTEKLIQADGQPALTANVLAVAGANSIEHVSIKNSLQYVRDILWRAGEEHALFSPGAIYGNDFPLDHYGVHNSRIQRRDLRYHMDGTPELSLDVGWSTIRVLEGATQGRMDGKRYNDIKTSHFKNTPWSNSAGGTLPNYWATRAKGGGDGAWFRANDVLRTEVRAWAEEFGPGPGYAVKNELIAEEAPSNTAAYTLKSRHIIDFDRRGRFYAAIRVEVDCQGGRWKNDPGFYEGHMVVDTHPSYTVRIYFESNWGGTVAQELLVQESCERPMFEALELVKINPYYWPPAPIEMERPVRVRMPPVIRPDESVMFQLKAMAEHQGVNTHMVMHDFNKDIPPEAASQDNVEFSYIRNGAEISHKKRAMGMLYARTFTLGELSDGLWLLTHTKCDAEEGGFTPPLEYPPRPKWFYMPGIKAALDKKFHIELRDGKIRQWSDGVPGSMVDGVQKKPPTDPTKREIKLYLV